MNRLPLSLFEQFLFFEDRPAYPCWINIKAHFLGTLAREPLQAAWASTVARHPLLHAIVERGRFGRLYWKLDGNRPPPVEWIEGPLENGWPKWKSLNLEKEPGFRLTLMPDGASTLMFLQFHHALCDGAGAGMIVQDILIHYARELGSPVEPPELRPELLAGRDRFGLSLGDKLRMIPFQLLGLLAAFDLLRRQPAALVPHCPAPANDPPPSPMPALVRQCLGPEEYRKVRDAAKRLKVGTNDLFIRDLSAAVGAWRTGRAEDWIRLGVPVNLRRPTDRFLPATNVVSLVILDRRVRSLRKRDRLLVRTREDMEMVKSKKFGYTFLILLALHRLLPGGLRRYAASNRCRSTLVLTNLGQFFTRSPLRDASRRLVVPGAVLDSFHMVGPLRPATCVNVAVGDYAGQLMIDLHYDPRLLTAAQAQDLLQCFRDQLALSVESPGAAA